MAPVLLVMAMSDYPLLDRCAYVGKGGTALVGSGREMTEVLVLVIEQRKLTDADDIAEAAPVQMKNEVALAMRRADDQARQSEATYGSLLSMFAW
jgi:hypothetical protein